MLPCVTQQSLLVLTLADTKQNNTSQKESTTAPGNDTGFILKLFVRHERAEMQSTRLETRSPDRRKLKNLLTENKDGPKHQPKGVHVIDDVCHDVVEPGQSRCVHGCLVTLNEKSLSKGKGERRETPARAGCGAREGKWAMAGEVGSYNFDCCAGQGKQDDVLC